MRGVGVMINDLFGSDSSVVHSEALDKEIVSIFNNEERLILRFTDGTGIVFSDEGQSCCEHRYMSTDDDLPYYVGSKFMGADIKDAPSVSDDYEEHEVQFLEIKTSKGTFTMQNHNEHNGYYGGFAIVVTRA